MPEAPEQINPQSLDDYLDIMSKVVFQSGMSWKVVEAKWPTTREAFHDFDVHKVADMSEKDVEDLTQDTRVIRNHRKLAAIVGNAQKMIDLNQELVRIGEQGVTVTEKLRAATEVSDADVLQARIELADGARRLDVDLSVGEGITALFGPSGAGKTTLLHCIAGLLRPDGGNISLRGRCPR